MINLGSVKFTNFEVASFSFSSAESLVEHSVLQGKPLLQRTGEKLAEITIGLVFLNRDGSSPADRLVDIESLRGTVFHVSTDAGLIYGRFVIDTIEYLAKRVTATGALLHASVELVLKEYALKPTIYEIKGVARQPAPLVTVDNVNRGKIVNDL